MTGRPAATTMSVRSRRASVKTSNRYRGKGGDQEDSEGENDDGKEGDEEEGDEEEGDEEEGDEEEGDEVGESEHVKGDVHGPKIRDTVVQAVDSQSRKTSDFSTAKDSLPLTHFDVPSFVCRVSNLSDHLASTSQIYSCDPRVQKVGMAHVRVDDFSTATSSHLRVDCNKRSSTYHIQYFCTWNTRYCAVVLRET
jgi:hypothetical protein